MTNDKHCLAPWTHTYLSPQSERRLCCASREPAQNFKQYIDKDSETGEYKPDTLTEHWNSDHMRSVRRRMMAGQSLPECEVCDKKLLNTSVYKDYFNNMFVHMREQLLQETDEQGYHAGLPISYDYRITNVCSFTCRMCGPMLSSAWEAEERHHNPLFKSNNLWAIGDNRKAIRKFQKEVAVEELWTAIRDRRISEIYWVGGEPLDWPEHWDMMQYMVEHDIAKDVYVRYNTNLSKIKHDEVQLYKLLPNFRDWQICASLDGVDEIGEYIRTGLHYEEWLTRYTLGTAIAKHSRQMRIDLTLTLPGMMGLRNIAKLANFSNTQLLTKVTFAFSPDIVMSPMCLPKDLLDKLINDCLNDDEISKQRDLVSVLQNMLQRPTFQEQWPEQYLLGIQQGKARILELELRRKDSYTMSDILKYRPEIREWWDGI
jgi:hypothetical protein